MPRPLRGLYSFANFFLAMTATTKKKTSKTRKEYDGPSPEEKLCAELVALMEAGLTPWRRPWQGQQGKHRNLVSGAEYHGSNPLLLDLGSYTRDHTLPLWMGAAQARASGWLIKKGSTAVRIIRPQTNRYEDEQEDGTKVERAWVSYKATPIFNAADFAGCDQESQQALDLAITQAIGAAPVRKTLERVESADAALKAWTVQTEFAGDKAFYSPGRDCIRMPHWDSFNCIESFYATWAHEQAHSTGHSSRLKRNLTGSFGSRLYGREELVAEFAAVMVCQRLEIGCEMTNNAAYLEGWASIIGEGPKVLFKVLSDAKAAADLLTPGYAYEGKAEANAKLESIPPALESSRKPRTVNQ